MGGSVGDPSNQNLTEAGSMPAGCCRPQAGEGEAPVLRGRGAGVRLPAGHQVLCCLRFFLIFNQFVIHTILQS